MAGNKSLGKAKEAKQDEFYTRLEDVENELRHYKQHFKGKTVFCNCDDPYESNFFKYFAMNFNYLGLKKLIATCYVSSPVMYTQLSLFDDMEQTFEKPQDPNKKPYKVEITEVTDENGDGAFDLNDIKQLLKSKKNVCTVLNGDGDFRSDECIELLKKADIVVTNPPFSLFREYVAQLMEYNKKFIIIGNQNAITYNQIFPLLKDNKMWLGYGFQGGNAYFSIPSSQRTNYASGVYNAETGLVKFRNCAWFTNLDIEKRHDKLILYKKYSADDYPEYDNMKGCINVDHLTDIPEDWTGCMGVPITFMDKYNPDQFEILGQGRDMELPNKVGMKADFLEKYFAEGGTGQMKPGHPDLCFYDKNNKCVVPYRRIIIRRKEQPQ